jgi:hypothetical protein
MGMDLEHEPVRAGRQNGAGARQDDVTTAEGVAQIHDDGQRRLALEQRDRGDV